MRDNKLIGALAGVTTVGSCLAIALYFTGGFGPSIDPAPHRAVGRVLAQQALSLLKPGGKITVITRDTVEFQNPAADIQFASFRDELLRARLKIDSIEALQVDPLHPVGVPAGDFFQLIRKGTKGSVIVSFMGPPALTDTQIAQLGQVQPSIVSFCPGPVREQVDLRSLFMRGLLHAAVVSKRNVVVAEPASEREVFERRFVAVTSGNLAVLSASNSSP